MIPVHQTIFGNTKGNCHAAVWASLLHLNISQVPNFVEFDDTHDTVCKFLQAYGYEYSCYVINENRPDLPQETIGTYPQLRQGLPSFGSIDGFYEAVVYSPGFFDPSRFLIDPEFKPTCHAVIVDKDLNIVHDPHPGYKNARYPLADSIGYNGVIGVCLWTKTKLE